MPALWQVVFADERARQCEVVDAFSGHQLFHFVGVAMLAGEVDWDVDASAHGFMELGIEPLHFDGREAGLFQKLTDDETVYFRRVEKCIR